MRSVNKLLSDVRACTICHDNLPLGPRPVLQFHPNASILIAGQAPGRKVHESGIPFDDASGKRLREWLGMSEDDFYNPKLLAILPMGFCFPGTGKSGDLPPRPECAAEWRTKLLGSLKRLKMTLVIGQYAQQYHCPNHKGSLTDLVKDWPKTWPEVVPLPHPSPRNNRWLKTNPWFEEELIPKLRLEVKRCLSGND